MTSFIHDYLKAKPEQVGIHSVRSPRKLGTRTTIVFLHDWGGSARTWNWVTPLIADDPAGDFQTLAIDFRG